MRLPFLRRQPETPPRWLIVGLGNPGAEYQNTRHNVGYRVVDWLADANRISVKSTQHRAWVGYGQIRDVPVLLAKPFTYMNLSGESIEPLRRLVGLQPADLVVVVDDMDLPVGRVRVRQRGSAGGHNGLKSLIQHLRTDEFPRVKIGVGRPAEGAALDHVLGKFSREELEPIADAVHRAGLAVETILTDGILAAMNRCNGG